MNNYECDQCGACCRGFLIVEVDELDVLREPRLIEADPHYAEKSVEQVLNAFRDDTGLGLVIACGTDRPCRFLGVDSKCTIYPTRPNDCIGMQAGDEQCQMAREQAGLPSLEAVNDSDPQNEV